MTDAPIYLDGLSTLPLAPEAREAMFDAWALPGNAGSPHLAGETAARKIAVARAAVASLIGAAPSEIVFTSGATEANNLAILGVARAARRAGDRRRRLVISAVEHKAVIEPTRWLEAEGFETVVAPVDGQGGLDLEHLSGLVDEHTLLVSVMAANNETGVIQPIAEAAAIAHATGALFHSDAAQAAGKVPIDVVDMDVDYLSLSAHKCYGPMGVGALFVAAHARKPEPLQLGGGQQASVRPGTEPTPLIIGFGAAAALAQSRLAADNDHGRRLADRLHAKLAARQVRFKRVTGQHPTVPGSLSISLEGVDAETLCAMLARKILLSTGSACTSGQLRVSHVLDSMGFSEDDARSVLRIFCSRYNDDADIDRAADEISSAIARSHLAAGEVRQ